MDERQQVVDMAHQSPTLELLDLFKKTKGIGSDAAAGAALGVGRSAVNNWRQRGSQAAPALISKMAAAIGEEPALWLARTEAARTTGDDQGAWKAAAKRISSLLGVVVAWVMASW